MACTQYWEDCEHVLDKNNFHISVKWEKQAIQFLSSKISNFYSYKIRIGQYVCCALTLWEDGKGISVI